jgi:hypothetical protein
MTIIKKDDLFELLLRMDKGEKQFYLKYVELFGQNSNRKLFKYLTKQNQFNAEQLKKDLSHEKFAGHLPVQKNKLYNSILKAMRMYHSDDDGAYRLWATLSDITFLQEKQLYSQIQKRLPKAKQHAVDHYQLYPLLKLISLERDLHTSKGYQNVDLDFLNSIDQSFNIVLKDIELIWRYRILASEISQVYSKYNMHSQEQMSNALTQLFVDNMFLDDPVPKHPFVQQYYYQVYLYFYLYKKDYKNAFKYIFQQIKCVQALNINNSKQIKNHVSVTINAIAIAFKAKASSSVVWKLITDLNTIFDKHDFLQRNQLLLSEKWFHETVHYIHKKELRKAGAIIKQFQNWFKQNQQKLTAQLMLASAGYAFTCADLKTAGNWIYKIKNQPRKEVNDQCLFNAYLMDIILSIELRQHFLADSNISNLERFLLQRKLHKTILRAIVGMLKKINNSTNNYTTNDNLKVYQEFKATNDLSDIRVDIIAFDFEEWLDQKIISYALPPKMNPDY